MITAKNSVVGFCDDLRPPQQHNADTSDSSATTSNARLLLLALTFFLMMVVMELALEAASTNFSHFEHLTAAVTLFQFTFCVALPVVVEGPRRVLKKFPRKLAEFAPYVRLAFAVVGATALATHSLHYVSYPTKVVFKSTKLIPTMIVSTIINPSTSKFGWLDYLSAACLCLGAAGYSYGSGDNGDTSTSYNGIFILTISICCDAIVPNMQQKLMQPRAEYSALPTTENGQGENSAGAKSLCARFVGSTDGDGSGLTAAEMMVNLNAVVVMGLLVYLILSRSLVVTIETAIANPRLLAYLLMIGAGLSIAVLAYTQLIKSAGSVVAVAVGTLRKVATIILSYVIFPKPFHHRHIYSGILVLAGLVLNSWTKERRKESKK